MRSFWLLLGLAFADLAIAGVMAGHGDRNLALAFVLLAVITAAFALFAGVSAWKQGRDKSRHSREFPLSNIVASFGAAAILSAAAYVAVTTTSVPAPASVGEPVHLSRPPANDRVPPSAPRPVRRRVHLLYKCVAADGQVSIQSQSCPPGSRQVWERDATPEAEPLRGRRTTLGGDERTPPSQASWSWDQPRAPEKGERSAACRTARAADAAYRRRPLNQITHDGLRRHGDAIHEACR
ncbi:hypothetical protein [Arenimonas fontis]|uniref:DUF4124 domain-containing protein n=1 Tax=Arenimonas fontis TaxID=2608255 RepID=A0A5B2Z9K8_9GAMM|nr:hypothetical protein [Arenimonas fontis]KAA2283960.1 hypothetical protein F0415_11690 [Arenimonas fontis]